MKNLPSNLSTLEKDLLQQLQSEVLATIRKERSEIFFGFSYDPFYRDNQQKSFVFFSYFEKSDSFCLEEIEITNQKPKAIETKWSFCTSATKKGVNELSEVVQENLKSNKDEE